MLFPPQPQAELADFYAAADVVLVPSRSESFGLVALEAQACGTPVVAAAVGGLPYVVEDGRTGFLVEGHDPGDHADRLLQILRDPGSSRRSATRRLVRPSGSRGTPRPTRCGRSTTSVSRGPLTWASIVRATSVTLSVHLSLFSHGPLPAHMCSDLRKRRA